MPVRPEPLIPSVAEFRDDGALYSSRFEDVYASSHGALAQAQYVFLGGNGLPQRWGGRHVFTIVETGFGAGLNFLATWAAFRQSASAGQRLHFVSVEKHPFARDDLARIHPRHEGIEPLAKELQHGWPDLIPGFHRLHFDGDRVTLTLLFGDAAAMLSQLEATADAFFLDGFAPARNAEMWSPVVFHELARLAAPGATFATYTAAAQVRDGLSAAGFAVDKRPGFAAKRDMLAGHFGAPGGVVPKAGTKRVVVIGAGLAGTSCAQRLAARGYAVEVIEREVQPALGASGNPAGLVRPVVSMDWNTHSRFTTAGYLYATRHHARLEAMGHGIVQGEGGVLQLARDAQRFAKQQAIVDAFALPASFVRTVDAAEATVLAGAPVAGAGWWFPEAVWAAPASMCRANLDAARASIALRYGAAVSAIERRESDWTVLDASQRVVATAPVVVLANAVDALALDMARHLPLRPVRGQVSLLPARVDRPLRIAVCGDGYVTPPIGGFHCVGASFNEGVTEPSERVEDHAGNLERLQRMLPGFGAGIDAGTLRGRVAFRTMAKDRLPIVGGLGAPGLYACLALGSRGMTWSALAAELLASRIEGEPLPLERELVEALAPQRFGTALAQP